jgi:hypothetical protein
MSDTFSYQKSYSETSRDRDFYGFVLVEGEAIIEGARLLVTVRHNNPQTEEVGPWSSSEYEVLEHIEQPRLLKVASEHGDLDVFELDSGRLSRSRQHLLLSRPDFRATDASHRAKGVRLLAAHASLVYGLDDAVVDRLDAMATGLDAGRSVELEGLRLSRRAAGYALHREGSPWITAARLLTEGWRFDYPFTGDLFASFVAKVRASLAGSAWRC